MTGVFARLSLPEQLVVQLEPFGAHIKFGPDEQFSYEEARYCSFLLRESPGSVGLADHLHVPLAAMFCKQEEHGRVLWEDLWQTHQIEDIRAWFRSYVLVVLRAQLGTFLKYGCALEAHQQNTCLEFTAEGDLNRIIYQELGGGIYWHEQRLESLPSIDFRNQVYERDDILEPWGKCINVLTHAMLAMHLVPLAHTATKCFELPTQELPDLLVSCLHDFLQDDGAAQEVQVDVLSSDEYAKQAARCIDGLLNHGETKALLKMRLMQTKNEMYTSAPKLAS